MPKRYAESDDEGSNKRRKLDKPSSIIATMEEDMRTVNKSCGDLNKKLPDPLQASWEFERILFKIPGSLLQPGTTGNQVNAESGAFKRYCTVFLKQVSKMRNEMKNVPELVNESVWLHLDKSQRALDALLDLVDELQESLLTKSAPSQYARSSVWRAEQSYPHAILCLRPTEKRGLPVALLHPIFSRFHQLRLQPLPTLQTGGDALHASLRLCSCMGNRIENEADRSAKFDEAMGNFLPISLGPTELLGRTVSGAADRFFYIDGRCIIIRVDKNEMDSGDPYTQLSRLYDVACENMERHHITPDAPVFLLCVMGPSLTIAGGFKDGADTVVEPLCPILLMLKDMDTASGRAMQLATHLFALRMCIEGLRSLPNPPSPASGLPRVFPSFQDAQGITHELMFRRRLSNDSLLFTAVCDGSSQEVFVKIIYGSYGEKVHRILASEKMAPELLGISRIEHGPTMIVMEMLDNSCQTLHVFAQMNSRWIADGVKPAILERLEGIVGKLEEKGLVHGDFRANNIMVKPGEEKSAVLIDFDWAGKAGEAYYPLNRNEEGIQWFGHVGSTIGSTHDRDMFRSEWNSLTQGS